MKVYLVRHGETEGNISNQFCGITDTPLTNRGIEQAKDAQKKLEGKSFEVVLSSPLSRAKDTARHITDQALICVEGLKEMDFGSFEKMTYEEIQRSNPEETRLWQEKGMYYHFPEGESVESFYDRVVKTYDKLLKEYKGKNLLIVAHSGVIRCILAREISENFEHYWKYKIDNCGVSIIEYNHGFTILEASNI